MTLDIVTKGIPFLHMAIVTAMVLAGVPRIFSYTALIWGGCAIMSISLIPKPQSAINTDLPLFARAVPRPAVTNEPPEPPFEDKITVTLPIFKYLFNKHITQLK